MKRGLTANLGWLLIVIGIVWMLSAGINSYSLIPACVGFFLRLIYNSEKYKYFKFLNWELLINYGKSYIQKETLNSCLFGFYRGVVDLIAVIILPFLIVPSLGLSWYWEALIATVYVIALKPIFTKLDETDREQIKQIVENYGQELQQYEEMRIRQADD